MSPRDEGTATLTYRGHSVEVPELAIVVTPARGEEYEVRLELSTLVVGSDPSCDLPVDDPSVSREHLSLSLTDRGVALRDMGSKNGTFVGALRVTEAILPPDAQVLFGSSRLAVRALGGRSVVPLSRGARFGEAIGASLGMRALFARLETAAPTDQTVLLLGESGTGKEVLAKAVHDASPRAHGPFVVFDCGAIAPGLVEAELFGYVRGAFTGANHERRGLLEQAHGGTLFLDEIGELPLELQPKLLRALEARQFRRVGSNAYLPFDARILAATHRDLPARVQSGQFRPDLFYRLAVVEARIPPLRERREDIELLVERFLAASSPPKTLDDLPPNTIAMLQNHVWPGNVRELRNVVTRLVVFPHLGREAIESWPEQSLSSSGQWGALASLTLREARDQVIEQFEQEYLRAKLEESGGNVTRAAEAMGVSRQFAHRLIERYGLKRGG